MLFYDVLCCSLICLLALFYCVLCISMLFCVVMFVSCGLFALPDLFVPFSIFVLTVLHVLFALPAIIPSRVCISSVVMFVLRST